MTHTHTHWRGRSKSIVCTREANGRFCIHALIRCLLTVARLLFPFWMVLGAQCRSKGRKKRKIRHHHQKRKDSRDVSWSGVWSSYLMAVYFIFYYNYYLFCFFPGSHFWRACPLKLLLNLILTHTSMICVYMCMSSNDVWAVSVEWVPIYLMGAGQRIAGERGRLSHVWRLFCILNI